VPNGVFCLPNPQPKEPSKGVGVMKAYLGLAAIILVIGCATSASNLNKVSRGMSKAEVVELLGEPESTAAKQDVEFLVYSLRERIARPGEAMLPMSVLGKYFVRLVNGKVESYGRLGDFDSTLPPKTRHEIDLTVKQKE
jgi:hypothetical protein